MMTPAITEYRIGLVMGFSGMNDAQHAHLRYHIAEVARVLGFPPTLIVSAIPCHERGNPRAGEHRAEVAVAQLLRALPWLKAEYLPETHDLGALLETLATCDEVHCATCKGTGSEFQTRPSRIYQMAQAHRNARAFKWLPFWIELDPRHLPTMGVGKKKKQPPALKG